MSNDRVLAGASLTIRSRLLPPIPTCFACSTSPVVKRHPPRAIPHPTRTTWRSWHDWPSMTDRRSRH